jgi:hypothetical protein
MNWLLNVDSFNVQNAEGLHSFEILRTMDGEHVLVLDLMLRAVHRLRLTTPGFSMALMVNLIPQLILEILSSLTSNMALILPYPVKSKTQISAWVVPVRVITSLKPRNIVGLVPCCEL